VERKPKEFESASIEILQEEAACLVHKEKKLFYFFFNLIATYKKQSDQSFKEEVVERAIFNTINSVYTFSDKILKRFLTFEKYRSKVYKNQVINALVEYKADLTPGEAIMENGGSPNTVKQIPKEYVSIELNNDLRLLVSRMDKEDGQTFMEFLEAVLEDKTLKVLADKWGSSISKPSQDYQKLVSKYKQSGLLPEDFPATLQKLKGNITTIEDFKDPDNRRAISMRRNKNKDDLETLRAFLEDIEEIPLHLYQEFNIKREQVIAYLEYLTQDRSEKRIKYYDLGLEKGRSNRVVKRVKEFLNQVAGVKMGKIF